MRSPTKIELEYLNKLIPFDIRDNNRVYIILHIVPIMLSVCVFWAIYMSSDNERTALLLFITCSLTIATSIICSKWYIYRKLEEINSHTAEITKISGHLDETFSFMSHPDGPVTTPTKYWIGTHETYLPYQWRSIKPESGDTNITAEVYISPWGKAYPVSIGKKFQLEKEIACESIKIKPVNLFRSALVSLSLIFTILAIFLPLDTRKTIGLAPVEAYYMIATHTQKKNFSSVDEALAYQLKPFQSIIIENAVLLPHPVEGFQARKAIVADPPEDLSKRVAELKKNLFQEYSLRTNPYLASIMRRNNKSDTGMDTMHTDPISTENIQKLAMKLELLFKKEYPFIQGGFITDDNTYPTKWLHPDEFNPPSIEAYPDVISYLDTVTRYHTIKGILIPRPTDATDTARFSYFIDTSRENYPFFSPFFLTIIFVVLLLMIVIDIVQAIRNSRISRRVRQFYETEN